MEEYSLSDLVHFATQMSLALPMNYRGLAEAALLVEDAEQLMVFLQDVLTG